MIIARCCPTCGRPFETRAGVRLPPLKAHIFDLIKATGDHGITSNDLRAVIYDGVKQPRRLDTVRNHILQINELLENTECRIVTHDRRHWIVTQSRTARRVA